MTMLVIRECVELDCPRVADQNSIVDQNTARLVAIDSIEIRSHRNVRLDGDAFVVLFVVESIGVGVAIENVVSNRYR